MNKIVGKVISIALGVVIGVAIIAMCITGIIAKVKGKGHIEYLEEVFKNNTQQEEVQEPTQDENTLEIENAVIKFNI